MANRFFDIQGKPISTTFLYQIKEDEKGDWSKEKYRLIEYVGNSAHFIGDEGGEFVLASHDTFLKVRQLEEVKSNSVQNSPDLESSVLQNHSKCIIDRN